MKKPLGFDWDDVKAASNLADHRISFWTAIQVFADPAALVVDTTRLEDREGRLKIIGIIGDRLFTVVYTKRGTDRRLISARRANKKERAYGAQEPWTAWLAA